ncbi:MAG: hypothetical protein ACOX5A_11905 [Aminivibrio sp.]
MTFKATILEVISSDEKKKKYSLLLDGGNFRPSGGGQPGDSGVLRAGGFHFLVEDAEKHPRGTVVKGRAEMGAPIPGMEAEGEVDMERHALLSRMHTGEHILTRALEDANPGLRIQKVNVDPAETTVYLSWEGELDWEMLFYAEREAERIVDEDLPVETTYLPKEEAMKLPGVKGLWDRIPEGKVRVVQIPDYDVIACSGSHVSSTGEVGSLFVTGYNGSAPNWEFRFSVEGAPLRQEYSESARRLHRLIGCRLNQMEQVVAGYQDENGRLKKMLERASQYINLPVKDYDGGAPVSSAVLPGMSRDLAAPAAKRWSEALPDRVLILLLPDREEGDGSFLLYAGKDVGVDFSKFLKETPSLSARGGGRKDWLNGLSPVMTESAWVEAAASYMERRRA